MKPPLLVSFLNAIVLGDLAEIEEILLSPEGAGFRAIVSSDAKGAFAFDFSYDDLREIAPSIVPAFEGPQLFFFSRELVIEANLDRYHSSPEIDWSIGFDTNVGNNLRLYICGTGPDAANKERVIALLKAIRKYKLQIDVYPFLQEDMRLTIENSRNRRPLRTVAAFKALDHLDWDAFDLDPENPVVRKSKFFLMREAGRVKQAYLRSKEARALEARAKFTHALLLKLAVLWIPNRPRVAPQLFGELVDFTVLTLGKIPAFELRLCLEFLQKPQGLRFFGPLFGVADGLLNDLRGMGWDLTHLRNMETMATRYSEKRFFVPFLATVDSRLAEMMSTRLVQVLVMDSVSRNLYSVRKGDEEFQRFLFDLIKQRPKLANVFEGSEQRRRTALDEAELNKIIGGLEAQLAPMVLAKKASTRQR